MSGPRCPITGRTIASSTSGRTSVGPGRKNRPNSMGFVTVALIGSGNGIRRCPNAVDVAKILRLSPSGKRSSKVAPQEVDAAAGRPEVDAPDGGDATRSGKRPVHSPASLLDAISRHDPCFAG